MPGGAPIWCTSIAPCPSESATGSTRALAHYAPRHQSSKRSEPMPTLSEILTAAQHAGEGKGLDLRGRRPAGRGLRAAAEGARREDRGRAHARRARFRRSHSRTASRSSGRATRADGPTRISWRSCERQVDKEALVMFICRSGARSHAAAAAAAAAGYTQCYNVLEGFQGDKDSAGAPRHGRRLAGRRAALVSELI